MRRTECPREADERPPSGAGTIRVRFGDPAWRLQEREMTPAEARLGEILERRRWLDRNQILRALRHQKVVGGKLGICLLEIEAISEDLLARALGEQQGLPVATAEDLRNVPPEVIALIPARVADRLRAIPFWASKTQVHVALGDGRNLSALDEVAFVTGKRVKPFVTTELRLAEALDRYYNVECPSRILRLLDRIHRQQHLWKETPSAGLPSIAPNLGAPKPAAPSHILNRESGESSWLAPAPFKPSPDLLDLGPLPPPTLPPRTLEPMAPAEASPPALLASPVSPPQNRVAPQQTARLETPLQTSGSTSVADATSKDEDLSDTQEVAASVFAPSAPDFVAQEAPPPSPAPSSAPSGDQIVAGLLEAVAVDVTRALLFRFRDAQVIGWAGRGEGLDPGRLSSFRIGVDVPSIFSALRGGAPWVRGGLAPFPAHDQLAGLLANPQVRELVVFPLKIRDRLVGALLLEPKNQRLEERDFEEAKRKVARASLELEMSILDRKLREI